MAVEFDLQSAIFDALDDDAALGAVIVGVYDVAPQPANAGGASAFPYVTIGAIVLTPLGTDEVSGFRAAIRIHSHSRSASMKQVKQIQGLIYDVLHDADLTVTGFNCVSILRDSSFVETIEDARFQGICEYAAILQKT
jgi:hypothetical protein